MEKQTAKLFQKTFVKDALGGSQEVLNYKQDITGYLLPLTATIGAENARVSVEEGFKFIADDRIAGRNLVVQFEGKYYDIMLFKHLYSKGSLMELKANE